MVPILITLTLMDFTLVFERMFSLRKANGRASITQFLKSVQSHLMAGRIDDAIKACDAQRGSAANIIRTGLERYKVVVQDKKLDPDKKMAEDAARHRRGHQSRDAAARAESDRPLDDRLDRDDVRSARHDGRHDPRLHRSGRAAGAPDAIQLSIGISEALINTALGLLAAIIGIVAYNFFVTKVDNFTYMIDEASYNVVQILQHADERLTAAEARVPCQNSSHTDRASGST